MLAVIKAKYQGQAKAWNLPTRKTCARCRRDLPLWAFRLRAGHRNGWQAYCRTCVRVTGQLYRDANPERTRAHSQANRLRHLEARRQADRDRYYRLKAIDPDLLVIRNEQSKAWAKANPDKARMKRARRRARERAATTVEHINLDDVLARAGGVCGLCRWPLGREIEFDHIVPLSRGGTHISNNLQATHMRCNRQKGARL